MSDTRIPQGANPPGQTPRILTSTETAVKLITVPAEVKAQLKAERVQIRLQGEVVRQNDDGSVRVRTQSGDVDVQVREGQPRPERGQRVELEIQNPRAEGRVPETATLREITRPAQTDAPQQRASSTPVDVQVREGQPTQPPPRQPLPADVRHAQNTTQQAKNPLPPEGSVVRLQPLPVRSAEALPFPEFAQEIVSTLPARVSVLAQVISSEAAGELQQAALNVTQPAPLQTPQVLNTQVAAPANTPAQNALPPVLVTNFLVPASPQPPQTTPQPVILPQAPAIQSAFIPAPEAGQAVPRATTTTPALTIPATPQRPALNILETVRQNVLAPIQQAANLITPKALPLDVLIEKISPPDIKILPPGSAQNIRPAELIKTQIEAVKSQPENLIVQNQKAPSLSGIVTNVTSDSLPVLTVFFPQTGVEQVFALQFPVENITIGTQIQVTPQTSVSAQTTPVATLPQILPLPVYLQPQPWPAMDDVLQVLARAAPQTAQAMVNVTPSPANPAQLGPAMMFFIAAVRGGDLSQWLGNRATDALRTERAGNALSRLMGEAPTLTRIAGEQMPQDWRALNIPLYWDGDMHKIALYYKHEREESENPESGLTSTRFVFDLALDRMGKVQVDGLFRPVSEGGTRLDVVLRTEEIFSQATQAEMRRVYAKALRDTQITGELSFQNQPESWVTIQADQENQLGVSA